jgi:hypothetical protein
MTKIARDVLASSLVALALAAAISFMWYAMLSKARADGMLLPPPPPPVAYGPPPQPLYSLPTPGFQGPPSQSCIETAIQLAYQTGSRQVGNAAAEACRYYAPVNFPYARNRYYGPPLGWQPPR